jgi:alkanesulfonate monooxygenase SsuD/methylene tetrahydromethanopterin reductase-like flavin-dependent oxidoreductase (luciferase family)
MLLAESARGTAHLELGPLVTNPYLRHPFQTVAALASLQDLAGARVFLGIGAGGSEVSGAAGIPRHDAPARVGDLIKLVRRVAAGQPLDSSSGRTLEVELRPVKVVIAGRGNGILRAAGAFAEAALLWAIPQSDLQRSVSVVLSGGRKPELIWAPLVDHGGLSRERVRTIAAYSVLNSHRDLHERWGMNSEVIEELRRRLVGGGAAAAQELVPAEALDDLVIADASPQNIARLAASIGATSLAIPAFSIDEVSDRVAWAREVLA